MTRVVLAGNNLAAVRTLDLLLELMTPSDVLVLSPPESEISAWQASLAAESQARDVECLNPTNVNDPAIADRVSAHDPGLFISVYYTQIFRGELMDAIAGRAVNFHPSLLPRHRGNAPLIWAIAEGDHKTGLTMHHIDAGIDTGRIIKQYPMPIHPNDTGFSLHRKMAHLVRATAAELLRDCVAGKSLAVGVEQSGEPSSHSARDPRLNRIDWSDRRERIRNIVRALAPPLPGAYATADGVSFVIARVDPIEAQPGGSSRPHGMVDIREGGMPAVWAADGPLQLSSVILDGSETSGSNLVERGLLQEGTALS